VGFGKEFNAGFHNFWFYWFLYGDILDWVIIWETYSDLDMVIEVGELCNVICRWR